MSMRALAVAAALAFAGSVAAAPAAMVDVLDTPAAMSPLAPRTLLTAVARLDGRLVAVGQRGHVVVSIDNGATWKQSPVPVSSDLTAVYFVDAKRGWAVGHDGVVLHTQDGGDSWRLQLDGRKANELLVAAMKAAAEHEPSSEPAKQRLADALRYRDQGADKPFLDVWFADANVGYVVGAYNYLFRTEDGGATWQPWFDRVDNPKLFNLYSIRPAVGDLYIAGESGLLLKLDPAARRFRKVDIPYAGSLFGVTGTRASVLAFGLRGTVLRSDDRGRTWTQVDAGLATTVVAAETAGSDGVLLADAGGRLTQSTDGGHTFAKLPLAKPTPLAGFAAIDVQRLATVGPRGVSIVELAAR
jgi:photosystem II stability/assembly factor-like uncharacterized protein